ncbi:MAG: UvrD/REP helicase [Bacteroidetes bacterium]|nr:UvrD/REP helicase [Bacteroidota bacterium]
MLNIYRASAGSGKTYRLTEDYIHLLFAPDRERVHRRILAVTFTNKATDEMKSRILKELHALALGEPSAYREGLMLKFSLTADAANSKARKILISILHDYSSFSISTIDRFFQQVIRSFAREIGVHGGYNLELDSDTTLQQSVDNLFLDLSKDENRQLLNWLTRFAEDRIEHSESWNPRRSIEDLGKEIFKESYQYKAEDTNRKLHDREFLQAYREKLRKIENEFEEKVKVAAQNTLDTMAAYGLTHDDFSYKTTKTLEKLLKGEFEIGSRFTAYADEVKNCYTAKAPQHIKNAIESAYVAGFQANIVEIIRLLTSDIVYYNSASIVLKHINTLGILSDLAMQIRKLTGEQNAMLISDANMLLNRIIDNSETPFVYEKTGIHIDHFMIDEFQDTSSLQWKNFHPLMANSLSAGKFNLVVGDVKQSIYRWRNSDWKLLDEKIMHDFRDEEVHEENLDTNWRSDRNIVAFNNEFFRRAATLLQYKLNESIQPVLPVYKNLEELTGKIMHAYGQLHQKTSARAGLGHVRVQFIERDENDEGWKAESLNRLPALLEELQERGYMPGDVALLVRTNGEEKDVIEKLLTYKTSEQARAGFSYDIMGNEGLMVESASGVRFILGVLRLFINPSDNIQQTIVSYEYARACLGLSANEALNACFSKAQVAQKLSPLFSDKENAVLQQLKNSSLFDMVERIIALFGIGTWYNEAVFVQAFQDVVFRFTSGRATDLYSFLKWWDKAGAKQTISTPENQQAFRIMTVHKSKGLDFKVVVMPFCDWEIDKKSGYFKNVLWCEPQEAPFNELPLLPVEYSSKLGNSVFAESYFDELMHQYIDNLNVAYVAFTRARHELICMAPLPKTEPTQAEKISSLAGLLFFAFRNELQPAGDINLPASFDTDKQLFCLGEPIRFTYTDKPTTVENVRLEAYPSVDSATRLRIRHQSLDYWLQTQQLTDSRLNYGIIMHDILRNIHTRTDQSAAVAALVREGRISTADVGTIEKELDKFWLLPEVSEWFAAGTKILNEATILTPEGQFYRPDRVVLQGNKATVIDYKFGDKEEKRYVGQVEQYMQLIAGMGYEVKGFLCYVSLAKVVKV